MDVSERAERLRLADGFRRSADDYLSERALRDALSRSYYSVFHLGCILLGKGYGNHDQFLKDLHVKLASSDELGQKVERLQKLRIQADYQFDAVKRNYEGDPKKFQEEAFKGLALGREAYNDLLQRVAREREENDRNN